MRQQAWNSCSVLSCRPRFWRRYTADATEEKICAVCCAPMYRLHVCHRSTTDCASSPPVPFLLLEDTVGIITALESNSSAPEVQLSPDWWVGTKYAKILHSGPCVAGTCSRQYMCNTDAHRGTQRGAERRRDTERERMRSTITFTGEGTLVASSHPCARGAQACAAAQHASADCDSGSPKPKP